MTTAAAVIIGDEILTGKVADTNTGVLVRALRGCGVTLARIVVIGDEVEEIGREVRHCSERYDWVITSGGVGPTHDDRTIAGIARAFDEHVVRPPELEQAVRDHLGDRTNEAALKMAEVPEGAKLLDSGPFPIVLFHNVYILPGVPHIFAAKVQRICANFAGHPPAVRRIYLRTHESAVADRLRAAEQTCEGIKIGSYPRFDEADHNLMITVEGDDLAAVDAAIEYLLQTLPEERLVRVDQKLGDA